MDEAEGFISKMDQRFKSEGDLLIQRLDAAFDALRNDIKTILSEYFKRKKCASVPEPVTELVIQQEFSTPVLSDAITLSYAINGKLSDPFVRSHRLRSSFYPYLFKIIPNEVRRIFDIQEYYFDFLRIPWPPPYHMVRVYHFGEFSSLHESAG